MRALLSSRKKATAALSPILLPATVEDKNQEDGSYKLSRTTQIDDERRGVGLQLGEQWDDLIVGEITICVLRQR